MNVNPNQKPTEEEIRQLVIARLRTISSDLAVSMGAGDDFTPGQLIRHVKKGDAIGKKISEIELNYLRTLKTPDFLQSLDE